MVSRELSKGKSSLLYHLQGESVGKVKEWLLKMQEEADLAIEAGATTTSQVIIAMKSETPLTRYRSLFYLLRGV